METVMWIVFGLVCLAMAVMWIKVEMHIWQMDKEIEGEKVLNEPDPKHNFVPSGIYAWRCTNCSKAMVPAISININAPYNPCIAR